MAANRSPLDLSSNGVLEGWYVDQLGLESPGTGGMPARDGGSGDGADGSMQGCAQRHPRRPLPRQQTPGRGGVRDDGRERQDPDHRADHQPGHDLPGHGRLEALRRKHPAELLDRLGVRSADLARGTPGALQAGPAAGDFVLHAGFGEQSRLRRSHAAGGAMPLLPRGPCGLARDHGPAGRAAAVQGARDALRRRSDASRSGPGGRGGPRFRSRPQDPPVDGRARVPQQADARFRVQERPLQPAGLAGDLPAGDRLRQSRFRHRLHALSPGRQAGRAGRGRFPGRCRHDQEQLAQREARPGTRPARRSRQSSHQDDDEECSQRQQFTYFRGRHPLAGRVPHLLEGHPQLDLGDVRACRQSGPLRLYRLQRFLRLRLVGYRPAAGSGDQLHAAEDGLRQPPAGRFRLPARRDLSGRYPLAGTRQGAVGSRDRDRPGRRGQPASARRQRSGLEQLPAQGNADRVHFRDRAGHPPRQLGHGGRLRQLVILHHLPRPGQPRRQRLDGPAAAQRLRERGLGCRLPAQRERSAGPELVRDEPPAGDAAGDPDRLRLGLPVRQLHRRTGDAGLPGQSRGAAGGPEPQRSIRSIIRQ